MEDSMEQEITEELLNSFKNYLFEQEKSKATIQKYMCDLKKLVEFIAGRKLSKVLLVEYKDYLKNDKQYKTSSINSFLAAANCLFEYAGWHELKVKTYKVQKKIFVLEERELSKNEYNKLVKTAMREGKCRIGMIIQTICATGIRVSELSAFTVAAVKRGVATIYNKGKERQILIPRALQVRLLQYIRKKKMKDGPVFRTSNGNNVDRSWIWREMKKLCELAGVCKEKVFPHNLRHLFAKTFYMMYKDIVKLADILGHNSIDTTRLYLRESYLQYQKQLERLNLVFRE